MLISCSKKTHKVELTYTDDEFVKLAHETTLNKDNGDAEIKFSDYLFGVNRLESKSLIYKRLSFFAISFENSTQACAEASRLNQYCARNWLFDHVEGEPILEDYVILTFRATNPKKRVQRIPKVEESRGHEAVPSAVHH